MKEKNTITLEEIEKNKIDENIEAKKKIDFKTFVKKEIVPSTLVCLVICVLITLVGVVSTLDSIRKIDGCEEIFCGNKSSMLEGFLNRLKMLGVTAIAALVPYFYLPFLGLFGYVYYEAISFAHVINIYGYALGVLKYIVPFVLNIFCISFIFDDIAPTITPDSPSILIISSILLLLTLPPYIILGFL